MKTITKNHVRHWDQTLPWRIVWHLGFFIKPLKNMYINKIRNDPDFDLHHPRTPTPPVETEQDNSGV